MRPVCHHDVVVTATGVSVRIQSGTVRMVQILTFALLGMYATCGMHVRHPVHRVKNHSNRTRMTSPPQRIEQRLRNLHFALTSLGESGGSSAVGVTVFCRGLWVANQLLHVALEIISSHLLCRSLGRGNESEY